MAPPAPIVLHEEFDIQRAKCILRSDMLPSAERRSLAAYIGASVSDPASVAVLYTVRDGLGRFTSKVTSTHVYASHYSVMRREVRAWLAHGLYHDIDVCNAQPTLCLGLLARYDIPAPLLRGYVEARDTRLKEVSDACGVDRDAAKELFLRISFHGTAEAWAKDHRVHSEVLPSFVKALQEEMRLNMRLALAHHPECVDLQKIKKPDSHNPVGCAFAYLMQDLERQCLTAMVSAAVKDGHVVGAMIHDGMLVRKVDTADEACLPQHVLDRWSGAVFDATGYRVALAEKPMHLDPTFVGGGSEVDDEKVLATCKELRLRFPSELGRMDETTFFLTKPDTDGSVGFECPTSGITGTLVDFAVHLVRTGNVVHVEEEQVHEPPKYLGLVFSEVVLKGPMSSIHASIPSTAADFILTRPHKDRQTLTSVTPHFGATLTQHRMGHADAFIEVAIPGKRDATISTRPKVDLFTKRVNDALAEHAAGTPFEWLIPHYIKIEKDDDRVRPDYAFLPLLQASGYTKCVVAITETEFYVLDASTHVWMVGTLGNAAGRLRAMAVAGLLEMEPDELNYVLKCDGGNRVIRSVFDQLQDRGFIGQLDTFTPKGCVAMDDGMYDATTDTFRGFSGADMVSLTIGYRFVPASSLGAQDIATIDTFYEQVFPDAAEREYFLRMMAAALFGSGGSKYFIILTDERDGFNGKTSSLRALEHVFGRLKASTERSFLHVATGNDPNAHAANLLGYKGKRLAFFDEPDKDAKLDVRRLKDLCSGSSTQSGRAVHGKVVEEFEWQALIVMACNEANFPVMDASDKPFLRRMKPLRMRAIFVEPGDLSKYEGEPHVFVSSGEDLKKRLQVCRLAHFHLLAAAYRRYVAAGGLGDEPPAVQEVLRVVMENADPRIPLALDFLDSTVDFAPERQEEDKGLRYFAWLAEKDLVNAFWDLNVTELKRNKEKKSDYTLIIRRAMELKDRKYGRMQPTSKETGKAMSVMGFDRVALRTKHAEAVAADTSSASERRFKTALEEHLGIRLPKARPDWLKNITGRAMELDMYAEDLSLGVEYNGPQHYKFVPALHASHVAFVKQCDRDKLKAELCRQRGVQLVCVRASTGVEVELAEFVRLYVAPSTFVA